MQILPLTSLQLYSRAFEITAEVGMKRPRTGPRGANAAVVAMDVCEFRKEMGAGYPEDSPVELRGLEKISSTRCYQMPVANFIAGEAGLSWYGESPLLWTLCNEQLGCKSIAFIATPSAVKYLRARHVASLNTVDA